MTIVHVLGGRAERRDEYRSWGYDIGTVLGKSHKSGPRILVGTLRASASMGCGSSRAT